MFNSDTHGNGNKQISAWDASLCLSKYGRHHAWLGRHNDHLTWLGYLYVADSHIAAQALQPSTVQLITIPLFCNVITYNSKFALYVPLSRYHSLLILLTFILFSYNKLKFWFMIYAIEFMNTEDLCIKSFCNLDHIALIELAWKFVVFDYTVCILIPNNITFHLLYFLIHSSFIYSLFTLWCLIPLFLLN